MSMDLFRKIESQVKSLEERVKKNNDFIRGALSSIEKLASDKAAAISDSQVVDGAIQAYKNVMEEMKEVLGVVPSVSQSVSDVISDVAKVASDVASGNIGDAINGVAEVISDASSAADAIASYIDK